jgi:hypothetical protein
MEAGPSTISRRAALLLGALTTATPAGASVPAFRALDLRFDSGLREARVARVLVPAELDRRSEARLLILLHGYGAVASESRGLRAWQVEYDVQGAHERLRHPPLVATPSGSGLTDARCNELNTELARRPFGGMVLVCPLTPLPYFRSPIVKKFAAFLSDELIPAVRSELSLQLSDVGLAGVSMGGRVGLEVMIERADSFSALCGLQSHFERHEAGSYAERVARAFAASGPRRLLLHTSTLDPYLGANHALSQALARHDLAHDLRISPGPHTAGWVRDAGALEALLWHDRTLQA